MTKPGSFVFLAGTAVLAVMPASGNTTRIGVICGLVSGKPDIQLVPLVDVPSGASVQVDLDRKDGGKSRYGFRVDRDWPGGETRQSRILSETTDSYENCSASATWTYVVAPRSLGPVKPTTRLPRPPMPGPLVPREELPRRGR